MVSLLYHMKHTVYILRIFRFSLSKAYDVRNGKYCNYTKEGVSMAYRVEHVNKGTGITYV